MSDLQTNPWDRAEYQRMTEAVGDGFELRVRFANGDEYAFDVRQLVEEAEEEPDWASLENDSFELTFPVHGELVELPWLQIRALMDDALAAHLADHAERQAKQVGHQLRLLREQRGLSSRAVAERAGMAPQSLSRIERGRHDIVFTKLQRLLAAMNYDLTDLARVGREAISLKQVQRALIGAGFGESTASRILYGAEDSDTALKRVRHIFNWSPTDVASERPPLLGGPVLAGRFKHLARERRDTAIYVIYANWLAGIVDRGAERPEYQPPPDDPEQLAQEVRDRYGELSLESLVKYAWDHGIAIVPLRDRGVFHGACWLVDGRPVIVLKQGNELESRWLFDLAHELCHVLRHLTDQEPGVIEIDAIGWADEYTDEEEREASEFAGELLLGDPQLVAERVVEAMRGRGEALKRALPGVAEAEGVPLGVIANYMAHRMSKQGLGNAAWGVAANLQRGGPDPVAQVRALLLEHLRWGELDEDERMILEGALEEE